MNQNKKWFPLIIGHYAPHFNRQWRSYIYLLLEPTTDTDYYQPEPGTILIPKHPEGGIIKENYKVNCKRFYFTKEGELEEILSKKILDYKNFSSYCKVFWLQFNKEINKAKKTEIKKQVLAELKMITKNPFTDMQDEEIWMDAPQIALTHTSFRTEKFKRGKLDDDEFESRMKSDLIYDNLTAKTAEVQGWQKSQKPLSNERQEEMEMVWHALWAEAVSIHWEVGLIDLEADLEVWAAKKQQERLEKNYEQAKDDDYER